jgi:hypothetical protein
MFMQSESKTHEENQQQMCGVNCYLQRVPKANTHLLKAL